MHIKYIEIDWHIHTDNKPSLKVLVDKIPDNDDFIYEEHDVGNSYKFYIANYRGHIRHFLSTSDKRGYGGRNFKINVYIPKIDEVVPVHIKGPWDSGVEYIYATTGKAAQNISLTDDFEVFKRGYTFSSAYFDIKLLKNYIDKYMYGIVFTDFGVKRDSKHWVTKLPKIDFYLTFALFKDNSLIGNEWMVERHFDKYYTEDWRILFKEYAQSW